VNQFTEENLFGMSEMSREEVHAILGPPGDYTTGPTEPWVEQGANLTDDMEGFEVPSGLKICGKPMK
jgi:hypothetical protein